MLPSRYPRRREIPGLLDGLSRIRKELDQIFDLAMPSPFRPLGLVQGLWTPSIDMFEEKEAIRIRAEIPGMKKGDIELSVQGNTLILQGERKHESEGREENWHRVERNYGWFRRDINLPFPTRADQAKASYQDGVLEIVLPKARENQPKSIRVE